MGGWASVASLRRDPGGGDARLREPAPRHERPQPPRRPGHPPGPVPRVLGRSGDGRAMHGNRRAGSAWCALPARFPGLRTTQGTQASVREGRTLEVRVVCLVVVMVPPSKRAVPGCDGVSCVACMDRTTRPLVGFVVRTTAKVGFTKPAFGGTNSAHEQRRVVFFAGCLSDKAIGPRLLCFARVLEVVARRASALGLAALRHVRGGSYPVQSQTSNTARAAHRCLCTRQP